MIVLLISFAKSVSKVNAKKKESVSIEIPLCFVTAR